MPAFAPFDPIRLLSGLRAGVVRARHAIRPDHLTLNQRTVLRSYSSVMTHAFLHAAVAPTRRLRRPNTDLVDIGSARAQNLGLPSVPHLASAGMHRFVAPDEEGSHARSLTVNASGLIEMLGALEQLPTPDGAWAITALDPCTQLARFAGLIASDGYGRLLGRSSLARRLHTRVDWTLGVTMTSAREGAGRGWRDIIVPDQVLERATGHEFGFMPPMGYGASRLRNAKRTAPPDTIVAVLLEEWLEANGYFRVDAAVAQITGAAVSFCEGAGAPSEIGTSSMAQN